jgi:hypothetical protein
MRYSLTALVTGCLTVTFALADEHLEPCQGHLAEYESRVEALSRAAMPGEVEFVVTVIPSFQPEWSVGVSADNGHFFLTHVAFQPSLWGSSLVQTGPNTFRYDFQKPQVQTTAKTANISAELHEALRSEWDRSIAAARPSKGIGLDGVTFKFQLSGHCGSAWSPDPETRNGKLIDLVMALALFADSKKDPSHSSGEVVVLRKLEALAPP